MVFGKYHQLWTTCGRCKLFFDFGNFLKPKVPMFARFIWERRILSNRIVAVPKQARYQTAPRPDDWIFEKTGVLYSVWKFYFSGWFFSLNLCGVHVVVANVSLVSEFFKSRKCRCLRGLFERGKFCLTELSQSQSKRATKLRHAPMLFFWWFFWGFIFGLKIWFFRLIFLVWTFVEFMWSLQTFLWFREFLKAESADVCEGFADGIFWLVFDCRSPKSRELSNCATSRNSFILFYVWISYSETLLCPPSCGAQNFFAAFLLRYVAKEEPIR